MTYTKLKQAIRARVSDKVKAIKLCRCLDIFMDHHRRFVGVWRTKNRSTANRASMSVPQILVELGLPDEKWSRTIVATLKREFENFGIIKWHKPWAPGMGHTLTKLADEIEPLDPDLPAPKPPTQTPTLRDRSCDVVQMALNKVFGGKLDPGVCEFVVKRSLGLA